MQKSLYTPSFGCRVAFRPTMVLIDFTSSPSVRVPRALIGDMLSDVLSYGISGIHKGFKQFATNKRKSLIIVIPIDAQLTLSGLVYV